MKINSLALITSIFLLFFLSTSLFAQSESDSLIYELIDNEDIKALQKLIDKKGIKILEPTKNNSYLEYAIDNCKLVTTEFLTKNKIPLGKNKADKEAILEDYIGQISCYLEENAENCMIPAFVMLVENDYISLKPTLLGNLNCYSDVLPEWYVIIQPVVKALIDKGLNVENSTLNFTGKKDNYLLEICKWEKESTEEGYKDRQKTIRKYILFLKEKGVDFNTKIKGKRPVDLLSSKFQKEVR